MTMSHALFENIYVEKNAAEDAEAVRILNRIGCTDPIYIGHYKDVFDLKRKDGTDGRSLILAHNPGKHLYEGAPVCQSFGNEHFYYSPGVMNCIYDCEYCFLKGMYPGRDICIFTDIDETFAELEALEKEFPVYVCASYNTDLNALESITGYVAKWCSEASEHENISVELRTKCSRQDIFETLPVSDRAIFAFTLSPDEVIEKFEKGTPSLGERLKAVNAAMKAGFPVRLCFDPMIYFRDWKKCYSDMIENVSRLSGKGKVRDIGIGTFRISDQYLKNMRKKLPDSEVVQYPYICEDGYYQYPEKVRIRMEDHIKELIRKEFPNVPIYDWR